MNRRRGLVGIAALVGVAVIAVAALVLWPRGTPGPDLDGIPESALVPDLPPMAPDGEIVDADLAHDSRSDAYRQPFGAVPAGT